MEGMIGIREQPQGCARAKPLNESPEQLLVGKLVAVSLQKQHRHVDLEQMAAAIVGRPSSRMQREAEKGETLNARQGRFRLRLRRHPAAERFAASNQGQSRGQPSGLGDGGADSGMGEAGRIWSPGASFHVRELIAQGGNVPLAKLCRHGFHERVGHARPRAMGQHVAGTRPWRHPQQSRDAVRAIDVNGYRL